MLLPVIALTWLLGVVSSADKIPMAEEWLLNVTSPTIKFNSYVGSLFAHPNDPQLLIITDSYAIWEFNPQTKTKTLIAGSKSSGSTHGRAEKARFGYIFGSAGFNKTTIVVSDYSYHCLKIVNTVARLAERYAGVCGSSGYKDGERLSAKFNYPRGLSWIGDNLYTCELSNQKIRQISQNMVFTLVTVSKNLYGLTSVGNTLVYSFQHGIGTYDVNTQTNRFVTYTAAGYVDGKLSSARFYNPYDIITLEKGVFAAADYTNRAVRIVDLNKQNVASVDVNITNAEYPTSLLSYNGNILAGLTDGRILKFSMSKLPITQNNITCEEDISLSTSDYSVIFQPQIDGSDDVECKGCPKDQDLTVGVHKFVYTYYNKIGSYIERICKQTVTVDAVLPTLKCPENIKLQLPEGSSEINVTLPQLDVGGTRLECVSCPSLTQRLSVGMHNVTFVYQDKLTKEKVNYSHLIDVYNPSLFCYNNTKHLYSRPNETLTEKLTMGEFKIRLDSDITELKFTGMCSHNYIIHDWQRMERTAYLQAIYEFDCRSLSALSFAVIQSDAKQHTKHLQKYCPGCGVSQSVPKIKCLKDKLAITWATNVKGNQRVFAEDMKDSLKASVKRFHDKYPEMDISVIHTAPRVAAPVKSESGLYLNVIVKTSCLKRGYIYDDKSDTCDKIAVDDADVVCPKDMKVILPIGVDELRMTLPRAQIDESKLTCVNCQDSVQSLSEGIHRINLTYIDQHNNQTITCRYNINMIKQSAPACRNVTRRLFLQPNQKKTDEIVIGETGVGIRLENGVHEVKIRDGCYITFVVNELSGMERAVFLEAEYPINCSTLNKISSSVINSHLQQHTKYMQKYCSVCQLGGTAYPEVRCMNDSLVAIWKTDINGNHQVLSTDIRSKLHAALVQFQAKYSIMDITVVSTLPRTISPIKDSTGLNIRVVIETTCTGKEFIYNKQYDVCQQVTN